MRKPRPCRLGSLARLTAAIASTALATHALGELPKEDISRVAVPKTGSAPAVDGAIGKKEWREAAAISGVTTLDKARLAPRPTTFYLA